MSFSIETRALAQSGLQLSALALGTVKFGRNQAVKYPTAFELPGNSELQDLLAIAKDAGINTLDTAPAYGVAEQRIGNLLVGQRAQWHIISKAGEYYDTKTGDSHYDYHPKALQQSLENSLRLLQTDYLDCWLLHSDGNDLANLTDEALTTFDKAKERGLVRAIGASTKTVEGGAYALKYMDCIMMAASLKHDEENTLFETAEQLGKSIILKKIFDSGWALAADDKEAIMRQTFQQLFSHSASCSAVIGTINPTHLQQNIAAFQQRQQA